MEAKTKYLLLGAGVLAVGGYLYYQNYIKNSDSTDNESSDDTPQVETSITDYSPPAPPKQQGSYHKPKPSNSSLPLKYGSRGTLVKDVQLALIKKHGGDILPKFGADGYFGDEMVTALRSVGLPTLIDYKTYGDIIKGKSENNKEKESDKKKKPEKKDNSYSDEIIADLLYSGISQRSIDTALRGLWKIKNMLHYVKVNEKFKLKRIGGGVKKTIVTALSHAFPFDPNRAKYRAQLYRIGLKWRNDKWALAGIAQNRLITIKQTKVLDAQGQSMIVPTNTIIGEFIEAKNGLTEFKTVDGKTLYTDTNAISFYHD